MDPELQFANPVWLWIGVLTCGALGYGFVLWNRKRELDLQKLAHQRLLHKLTQSFSRRRRWIRQGLWLAAVFLIFVATARPQYGFEFREVKRRGIDLVFAIDTSRSMSAEDVVPNRLERSQLAITDFIDRLEGDRIGLIPFAGKAFSLCPLTLDYGAFRQSLDAITTDIIPHQGTDLASAVDEANLLFDEEGNSHRILILITDGEDLQGAVSKAISSAAEKKMVIHTVGVGNPEGALIPLTRNGGYQDFVRDENGKPVKTSLDESTLRKISEATGGIYAPLGKGGEGLNQIYQEKLRLVPKTEMDQRLDRIPLERYEWPLAIAIFLLLLEYMMNELRKKKGADSIIRRALEQINKSKRKVSSATIFFALASIQITALGTGIEVTDPRQIYNSGTNAYQEGNFEKAEQSLTRSLEKATELPLQQKGYYNLGNTRYRLGQKSLESNPEKTIKQWETSVKAYEDALALNARDSDAEFNRDFVKKKLDELKQQQKQDQQQQDEKQQDQQQKDQQKQDQGKGKKGEPGEKQNEEKPQPKPGEEDNSEQQPQNISEERKATGEMTREEAARLLEALMKDERSVTPLPDRKTYQRSNPSNTTRGKTW